MVEAGDTIQYQPIGCMLDASDVREGTIERIVFNT